MDNASPNNNDSPKTPGGIRKALLTPCRRVGLSRKWSKSGCSPFISPLSGHNAIPDKTTVREEKKLKKSDDFEQFQINSNTANEQLDIPIESSLYSPISFNKNNDLGSTPCRRSRLQRKKCKTLSLSLKTSEEADKNKGKSNQLALNALNIENMKTEKCHTQQTNVINDNTLYSKKEKVTLDETVLKPVKQLSDENLEKLIKAKSDNKKISLNKSLSNDHNTNPNYPEVVNLEDNCKSKGNSPNNLTKECIVAIQNSILKTDPDIITSKVVDPHDSDSELDIPLSVIKKESIEDVTLNTLEDDDFLDKTIKKPIRNLSIKRKTYDTNLAESSNSSQSSQENSCIKRTIIVKKNYDKVVKLQKAKSTGSITQKDIDELKARIEMKKKLLLANAMSVDTEDLRGLIKKWQKGCQHALMELLDLMKKKLPEKKYMGYAEILGTLKIPAELIGYDPENDCFVTPDDTSILLSAFKL